MSMDEDLFDNEAMLGENEDENDNSDMDIDPAQNDPNGQQDEDEDNDDNDEEDDDDDDDDGDGDGDDDEEEDEENENENENEDEDEDDEDNEDNENENENENENDPQNNEASGTSNNNDSPMLHGDKRSDVEGNGRNGDARATNNRANHLTTSSSNHSSGSGENAVGSSVTTVDSGSASVNSLEIRRRAVEAVKNASEFDIVPMVAIPYVQQCHAVAFSDGPKWLLTGGEDGFIRKYDFAASIDGKAPLTVAQKHNLMDNINKGGVLGSYWENEQPMTKSQLMAENPKLKESDFASGFATYDPKTNPVYSLDVERNGYWCLSGLLSGGISLYTMIYNEGAIHHYFRHNSKKGSEQSLSKGHSDAVSVLRLNHTQTAFLSGSWDKTIREWDLNTGKVVNIYKGSTGQISSIRFRSHGLTDLTFDDNQSDVDSLFGSEQEEDDDETANGSKSNIKTNPSKNKTQTDDKIFMSSSMDGTINIWDARVSGSSAVLKLGVPDGVPPWCMTASWSNDGDKIYVGRRNSTVEEISLRMPHTRKSGNVMMPNVSKRLMFPKISGPVSALSIMPNDNFIFCGSNDNIRLYNLGLYDDFTRETVTAKKRATPFYVIPGHHGGVLSNLIVEDTGRFMISTSGNRGWGQSAYADVVLIYSIETEMPQQ